MGFPPKQIVVPDCCAFQSSRYPPFGRYRTTEQNGAAAAAQRATLHKYGIVATRKLEQLQQTMNKLLPQIRYWIRTGYVASNIGVKDVGLAPKDVPSGR
jgi:hypothetical protein